MTEVSKINQKEQPNAGKTAPKFYTGDSVRGYNAFITICCGARGIGKTFDWLKWAVCQFEKYGHKFAWVRRTEKDIFGDKEKGIQGCAANFGRNVTEVYPRLDITTSGNLIFLNGEQCGEFRSLTGTQGAKGETRETKDLIVNMIVDEFLIDTKAQHYIGGNAEPDLVANLYQSIARPDGVRGIGMETGHIVLLANATSFANPYFYYWNITPFRGKYWYDPEQLVVVEMSDNEAFAQTIKETRFGRAFRKTKYGAYAFDNSMLYDSPMFIEAKKPPTANKVFQVSYVKKNLCLWMDAQNGTCWIGEGGKDDTITFAVTKDDMTLNTILLRNPKRTLFNLLIESYRYGDLRFQNMQVKSIVIDIMRLFGVIS